MSMAPNPSLRSSFSLRWRTLAQRSRAFYTPVSLLFIGYFLLAEYRSITENLGSLHPGRLALVLLLIAAGHVFIALSSTFLFRSLGCKAGFGMVFAIHVNRLPARYLPGGIWQTVSRAADFSALGMTSGVILRVVMLEMALSTGLAALLGAVFQLPGGAPDRQLILVIAALAGLTGLIAAPLLARRLLRDDILIRQFNYAAAVGAFLVVWMLYGTAFFLFLSQILSDVGWFRAVGVYLSSWLIGFLAFFAPQGIGVFEVTSSFLLTGSVASVFVASVFAFRLFSILTDLLVWILFRLVSGMQRAWRDPLVVTGVDSQRP
jgi:uncharacterized membrane protein YbhN (UPF0104 family)